jgi:uncharacterized membrane protein
MRPILFALAFTLVGCSDDHSSAVFGPPTESTCPPNSTITYASFGQQFMERYCTRCHSSELVGAARQGAPSFHDFDTQAGVKGVSNHIDETTASGPAATNTGMPPNGPKPTMEERVQLGEWIACDVP